MSDMGDVRKLVNKLYTALNVDEHQVHKERELLSSIEDIKTKLAPLEKVRAFIHFFGTNYRFNYHYF